ncbi:VTT domain-containing protein [Aneurinibacillus tyrosinisolvens]|uniref:VTT domain-containing protein n=1 Tax=Aneurinibacillus tyrosinisolvens TaxID=1443435 RepID=UPI00069A8084|nr:VTT domain-containing protein [Aneurinibacillus tyrosinisolvens]
MGHLTIWVNQYGYSVLFFALMLELLALPFPGEALMGYAGLLVFQGKLNWVTSILMAGAGSALGMTLSYWIGFKLGTPFFYKYGHYIHLGPERLEKVSGWFSRYGNKLLVIAYFIPGVRHFTGYFSGINRLPFRTFALYAYTGAFIWTATFISLGKVLGPQWEHFHGAIKKYLLIAGIVIGAILILYLLYKSSKERIKAAVLTMFAGLLDTFHSLGRVKLLVTGTAIMGVILFIFAVSFIEDYLSNEFKQFDTVVLTLIPLIFSGDWTPEFRWFDYMSSVQMLAAVAVLTLLGIAVKGENRGTEMAFLCFAVLGGGLFEQGLRYAFYHLPWVLSPVPAYVSAAFPSAHTLMAVVVYGFAAFLLIRHSRSPVGRIAIGTGFFLVVALVGLSRIYFQIEYPSDVTAGYIFGGVWLSLNAVLLEMNRLLQKVT